jgi:hypothetical protein
MQLFMRYLITVIFLVCVLAVCASGCGPSYDYGYGYPAYGYAPYWGGFRGGESRFEVHHPWEDHGYGHPYAFYREPTERFASAGHFGGFHGGGFHGGGFHGWGGGHR